MEIDKNRKNANSSASDISYPLLSSSLLTPTTNPEILIAIQIKQKLTINNKTPSMF